MFKKCVSFLLVLVMLFTFTACGNDKTLCKNVDDKQDCQVYRQWGAFDYHIYKDPDIEYGVVIGNVIWSVLFAGTIAVPVILFGWYLYEPIDWKSNIYKQESFRQDYRG